MKRCRAERILSLFTSSERSSTAAKCPAGGPLSSQQMTDSPSAQTASEVKGATQCGFRFPGSMLIGEHPLAQASFSQKV